MKILIVGKVTSNQVGRLSEEAKKLGHKLDNCSSYSLVVKTQNGQFKPVVKNLDLTSYDVVYLLTVGDRKWEWHVVCKWLKNNFGMKIIEEKMTDPSFKVFHTATSELAKQVEHNINFPKTTVIVSPKTLEQALEDFKFPVIIKNDYQERGLGVHKADNLEQARRIVEKDTKAVAFQIREFIPNDGDIRIFTVGFEAIGAMKRTPPPGDFKSNISRGGKGEKFDLDTDPQVKEIAENLAKLNHTQIAGVDIIIHKKTNEHYVLEINRSPQFRGLEKYTGVNAAGKIIKYFESLVNPT